ncbi:hypothetical protein J4558_01770 [Leptolyngbya sp. 15MV]|nr:hypothetical protein J4558_01770 [Leptolyngbya sp. 15MV]
MRRFPLPFFATLFVASPAFAASQSFEPCVDATSHPSLAGSLCLVASAPLNPSADPAPTDRDISLFVRKFPTDPRQRRGEVWLVAGGPGESGVSFYPALEVLRRAFPDHDLVVPDHRGTGYSSKLCPAEEAQSSPDGMALANTEWGSCIGTMHAQAERTRAFTVTNAACDLWRTAVPGGDLRVFMGSLLNFPELRDRIPAILSNLSNNDTGSLSDTAFELGRRLGDVDNFTDNASWASEFDSFRPELLLCTPRTLKASAATDF